MKPEDIELQKIRMKSSLRNAYSKKEWKLFNYCRGYIAALEWVKRKLA